MTMPRIQVNDIAIYYELHGMGFPLLLIAGLGADHTSWDDNLIRELASNFQTILIDNRGAGGTDNPEGSFTINYFAADAASLLNKLGISRAYVLGHSMGGYIAQQLAIDHPEMVAKLILCSTTCGAKHSIAGPEHATQGVLDRAYGRLTDDQIIEMRVKHNFTEEFQRANPDAIQRFRRMAAKNMVPPEVYGRQLKAMVEFDSFPYLQNLRMPTLVLHGKKDTSPLPENAEILAKNIPGAKLAYFNESAHALYTPEPEDFIKILLDFLL
ncbi:MAG: putative hydrolase or acyltransferase of alpha /beta superfamily [Promethearchaeota archaeon CR_4]|nr:MAG: putative hydrolase or acyltransferase of alpha /beta superfamily [Candidatus Lokiarchaeota archaeon CR_4]